MESLLSIGRLCFSSPRPNPKGPAPKPPGPRPPPLRVISFTPYIEDSVLGLSNQDSGLFLKNGGRPFMRQRLRIHPPSQNFTSVYLTCSLRNSLLNTLISKGCYRLFKWAMHAGFFVSTWGGRVRV